MNDVCNLGDATSMVSWASYVNPEIFWRLYILPKSVKDSEYRRDVPPWAFKLGGTFSVHGMLFITVHMWKEQINRVDEEKKMRGRNRIHGSIFSECHVVFSVTPKYIIHTLIEYCCNLIFMSTRSLYGCLFISSLLGRYWYRPRTEYGVQ